MRGGDGFRVRSGLVMSSRGAGFRPRSFLSGHGRSAEIGRRSGRNASRALLLPGAQLEGVQGAAVAVVARPSVTGAAPEDQGESRPSLGRLSLLRFSYTVLSHAPARSASTVLSGGTARSPTVLPAHTESNGARGRHPLSLRKTRPHVFERERLILLRLLLCARRVGSQVPGRGVTRRHGRWLRPR